MKTIDIVVIVVFILVLAGAGLFFVTTLTAPSVSDSENLEPIETVIDPIQNVVSGVALPLVKIGNKDIFLTARAEYKLSGVLVSKHKYSKGFMSDLSPWDYAVVWGAVPDLVQYIEFSKSIRFCFFKFEEGSPVSAEYVSKHFSNNHLIPSTGNIRKAMAKAKKGMKVQIFGYLVDVQALQNGVPVSNWNTSMVRTDKEGGACEIIYVTRLRLEDKVYE